MRAGARAWVMVISQVLIKKRTVQLFGILIAATVATLIALAHYTAYQQLGEVQQRTLTKSFGAQPQGNAPDPARTILLSGLFISFAAGSVILIGVWLLNRRIHPVFDQLEQSEVRYRTMIQSMDEGVVVVDEEGVIDSINPAVETLFGYAGEELLGRNVKLLMPPAYAERHDDYLNHYLETGEKHIIGVGREVHGRRRDGSEFPMQLFVSEMEIGGRRLFTGIVHDISERKKVEAEVIHARERAEQAAAAKSQFLANMSHEIRTPMNGVLGMLDLLSEAKLDSAEKEYVHMARQSAVSLLSLIDDILDLSKIEAGRIELEWEITDLHELIEDMAAIGASLALEKDVRLNCYIAPDVPRLVPMDPARLRQVMLNLLSNAVKFTDQGEVNLTAELEEEQPDGILLRLTVEDTGIGIERTQLDNLFEPFEQADSSITRRFGGTGLGLTISRHLVELMGGKIQASSEPGGGSAFTFTTHLGPAVAEQPSRVLALPESLRVLLVDNNSTALENIENYLQELGVERISTARDTNQAKRLLQSSRAESRGFDLILIKHPLPGAAELVDYIRCSRHEGRPQVVAMSPVIALKKEMKRLQADCILVRPVRRAELKNLAAEVALPPQDAVAGTDDNAEARPPNDWRGVSVLLAEDHPVNQIVCQKMFQHFGIELEVVADGEQAVELMAKRQFDLVLIDCQMPVMDGYTATRQIRARESEQNLSRTTIVAVTAHAMEGDRDRCLASGMDDYIKKPYRLVELEEMLSRWLPTKYT